MASMAGAAPATIYTSQIAFAPADDIFAVLGAPVGSAAPDGFAVAAEPGGGIAYRSQPGDIKAFGRSWHGSGGSGDTYVLSPRAWRPAPGSYRFVVGATRSAVFRVSRSAYDVRHTRPLYYFRVQRSGVEMAWEALDGASGWRGPDYLDDARQGLPSDPGAGDEPLLLQQPPVFAPGTQIPTAGGWFDAGDYNKYMGNTPWAVYNLLLAYERHPDFWRQVDEDGDGVPDILFEARWALDWMLTMCHPDGSVYERIFSGYDAPFDGRPDLQTDNVPGSGDERPLDTDRWADITSKASYAFAAAYRVFSALAPPRAARYLDAAERTWQWSATNRQQVKEQRYGGGLYFGDVAINLTLAAAELFLATGREDYRRQALGEAARRAAAGDWTDVSSWEYHPSLALQRCHGLADGRLRGEIEALLARATQARIARQAGNPYRVNDEWLFVSKRGQGFGQNDLAAASALDALWLFERTGERRYRDYAVDEIQWIWGRNPVGICGLATPLAERYPRLHHTRVTAMHPLEGVVVPGPTDHDGDGLPDFTDNGDWYYSEPTINQQAVYLRALAELHFASGGSDDLGPLPG